MALTFHQWFNSEFNPMRNASRLAQEYTADALKAAFEAGQSLERELHRPARDTSPNENIFT